MNKFRKRVPGSTELIRLSFMELLKEKDLNSISISHICAHAGVGRNTFYRNYSTKEEVLDQIIRQKLLCARNTYEMLPITDFQSIDADKVFAAYVRAYHFWDRERDFLQIMVSRKLYHRVIQLFPLCLDTHDTKTLLAQCNSLKNEVRNNYFYVWLSTSLAVILEKWTLQGFLQSPEEMAQITLEMFHIMGQVGSSIKR